MMLKGSADPFTSLICDQGEPDHTYERSFVGFWSCSSCSPLHKRADIGPPHRLSVAECSIVEKS